MCWSMSDEAFIDEEDYLFYLNQEDSEYKKGSITPFEIKRLLYPESALTKEF